MNFMICEFHFNKMLIKLFWLNSGGRDCHEKKAGVAALLNKVDLKIKSVANDKEYQHRLKRGSVDLGDRTVLTYAPITELPKRPQP